VPQIFTQREKTRKEGHSKGDNQVNKKGKKTKERFLTSNGGGGGPKNQKNKNARWGEGPLDGPVKRGGGVPHVHLKKTNKIPRKKKKKKGGPKHNKVFGFPNAGRKTAEKQKK